MINNAYRRRVALGVAAGACFAAAASMLVSPPGLVAVAIAVFCLWPWDGTVERGLAAAGVTRRTLVATGTVILVAAAIANLVFAGQLDGHLVYRGDFQTYYVGAQVGLRHGWSHLFDQGLQRPFWLSDFGDRSPFIPFLNTPPQAWLIAPLARQPYLVAYATWVAAVVGLTALCTWLVAAPRWQGRAVASLVTLSLWVVAYSWGSGQNAIFGALAIVLCWRCAGAGRAGAAGIALGMVALRPNATFLIPVAVMLAGHRRAVLAWLAVTVAAGVAVLLSLGPAGIRQFLELGAEVRRTHPGAVSLTAAHVLGGGVPGLLMGVALAAAGMAVAFRAGPPRLDKALAAGVLASLFLTPYIHVQDVITLFAALAILARRPSAGLGLLVVAFLLLAPPGSLFGAAWPVLLLLFEIAMLGWLALQTGGVTREWRSHNLADAALD